MSEAERCKRLAKIIAMLLAFIGVAAVTWAFDPSSSSFPFPKCPVKVLTGWDCPGCGSTRALHCVLHGDFSGAIGYNAALPVGIALVVFVFAVESFGSQRMRRIFLSPAAVGVVLLMALAWTIYRNL